jgi:MFS family permease
MLPTMAFSALALTGLVAAAASHAPGWLLVVPSALSGLTGGSIGPLVRARWAYVLRDSGSLHTAYSLESALDESTFIVGPVLATMLATQVAPTAGLIAPIVLSLVGAVLLFSLRATEPPVWEAGPPPAADIADDDGPHPGPPARVHPGQPARVRPAIFIRGVAPVAGACLALGWLFGACDLTVVAAVEAWGAKTSAGLVLAAFSAASMLSGLAYGARKWTMPLWKRFVIGNFALLASATVFLASSPATLAVFGAITGLAVAPTLINAMGLVQRMVPAGRLTEGLTWISTALGIGLSIGSTMSGLAVDQYGPKAGFAIVVAAACLVVVVSTSFARVMRGATQALPAP